MPRLTLSRWVGSTMSGSGTSADPFLVSSPAQLYRVRKNLSAHYLQTNDIDLTDYHSGIGWTPIGAFSVPFTGIYDGAGHGIKNMRVDNYATANTYGGLFGSISKATLRNITIQDAWLSAFTAAFLVADYTINSTISNCHVRDSYLEASSLAGGLIGAGQESTIHDCSTVTESSLFTCGYGGIFSDIDLCTIDRCWCDVTITAQVEDKVEGIWQADSFCGFGVAARGSEITDCYSTGQVRGSLWCTGFIQVLDTSIIDYVSETALENCYCAVLLDSFVNEDPYTDDPQYGAFVQEAVAGATVTSCYFDEDVATTTETAAGTAKTTINMKKQATFVDWDFTNTWAIVEDTSYPTLQDNPE